MKPEIDQILGVTAGQLLGEIAPQMPPGYSQSSAGLLGILLTFCAQEYERGAHIRMLENAQMRALFGVMAPSVRDADLKEKLEHAAVSHDAEKTVSALNAANSALKALLIALQCDAELRDDRDAQAQIWRLLDESAERRLLKLPGM